MSLRGFSGRWGDGDGRTHDTGYLRLVRLSWFGFESPKDF